MLDELQLFHSYIYEEIVTLLEIGLPVFLSLLIVIFPYEKILCLALLVGFAYSQTGNEFLKNYPLIKN